MSQTRISQIPALTLAAAARFPLNARPITLGNPRKAIWLGLAVAGLLAADQPPTRAIDIQLSVGGVVENQVSRVGCFTDGAVGSSTFGATVSGYVRMSGSEGAWLEWVNLFADRPYVTVLWSLRRDCDGRYWNGTNWVSGERDLATSVDWMWPSDIYDSDNPQGVTWDLVNGKAQHAPGGGAWAPGTYTAEFWAECDGVSLDTHACHFGVHSHPPTVNLSTPQDAAGYYDFPPLEGDFAVPVESDTCGGTFYMPELGPAGGSLPYLGDVHVLVQLQRKSDGAYYDRTGNWSTDNYYVDWRTVHSGSPHVKLWGPPFPGEDTYFMNIKAVDALQCCTLLQRTFVLDQTPPSAPTITWPATGSTVAGLPTITGRVNDNPGGSGISEVNFFLTRLADGKVWNGNGGYWSSPPAIQLPVTTDVFSQGGSPGMAPRIAWASNEGLPQGANLPDGDYQVKAWAVDNAGNQSTNTVLTFHVLASAPTITMTSPADQSAFANQMPAIAGAVAAGIGLQISRVDLVLYQNWFDTGTDQNGPIDRWEQIDWSGSYWEDFPSTDYLPCTVSGGSWSYQGGLPTGADLVPARYSVGAVAYDSAGHSSWVWHDFYVDSNPPGAISVNITNGMFLNRIDFLAGSVAQPIDGAPISLVELSLRHRHAAPNSYWSGTQWQDSATTFLADLQQTNWDGQGVVPTGTNLSEGTYDLWVTAINAAGYTNARGPITFVVDLTPPTATILAPTNGARLFTLGAISGIANDNLGSNSLHALEVTLARDSDTCYWTGGQWVTNYTALPIAWDPTNGDWSVLSGWLPTDTNLSPGDYTASIVAYDAAGNDSHGASSDCHFTVPTANPQAVNLALSPETVFVGDPGFDLTIIGTNFLPETVVYCNGVIRQAVYLDSTRMQFTVDASELTSPTTNRIAAWNPSPGGGGLNTLYLQVLLRPVVPNDSFANRIALSGASLQTTGGNAGASYEAGEPLLVPGHFGGRSVWWSWTAPADGSVTISTAGSDFPNLLALFTGTVLTNLTPVASGAGTNAAVVMFAAQKGTEYVIGVDGVYPAFGDIQLSITMGGGVTGVLFQDNFNTSANSSDLNFENAQGRQAGGSLGVLNYVESSDTAADGADDWETQANPAAAPGQLVLIPTNNTFVAVSPSANFTQSCNLTIEFDLNPGINDTNNTSTDWAGVIFGATTQNAFITQSDGMGILFRNNRLIQVFDGSTLVYEGDGGLSGGLPKGMFHVRLDLASADFQGSPATVTLTINGVPAKIAAGASPTYLKNDGFHGNYLTLEGYADWNNGWLDAFDNLKISVPAPVAARLEVQLLSSGKLLLRWPAALAGYGLQAADTLEGPWELMTAAVVVQGDQNTVTLPATGQAQFFRLSK